MAAIPYTQIGQCRTPYLLLSFFLLALACPAGAQTFRVQCPTATLLHPIAPVPGSVPSSAAQYSEQGYLEAAYSGPTTIAAVGNGVALSYVSDGGAIKCQQVSGGDGFMTEADGNQTFMFSFGPLSGLSLIQHGLPGTLFARDFLQPYNPGTATFNNGQPNPLFNSATGSPDGAVTDVAAIIDTGVMNGNIPGPLMAIDEDDEFFLTLTNVGMIMRPDLFEQHTIHFHGYPNASSYYDGVPDASLAINIGGSFTYYYLAPDAGTYFWHCHITPPEHLQMGMVGQLYVRPRQNRVPAGADLYASLVTQQRDLRTACNPTTASNPDNDLLCSTPLPAASSGFVHQAGFKYAYNDGDGSTRYDVDVPIQIHGFDPNFHFIGMTFNPEGFADMKDKYFLLNGRSYPDTVGLPAGSVPNWSGGVAAGANNPDPATHAISTEASDGMSRTSQPMHTLITLNSQGGPGSCVSAAGATIPCGQRALLRISDLDVSEYQTLASLGVPLQVVGYNAKLLRDLAGNNLYYATNSITLGGGESLDAILDSTGVAPGTYFLYTPNLDHLSNDSENFGGLMTEIVIQ